MQKEEILSDRPGIITRSRGFLKTRPDVSTASHTGTPTMTFLPGNQADETLSFGAAELRLSGAGSAAGNTATAGDR